MRNHLFNDPFLAKPTLEEILLLYIAIADNTVSTVLVKVSERTQNPIYYTSNALLRAETRYSDMEKLALALISAMHKLRHYFQSHSIIMVSSFPLREILHKQKLSE